MSKVLSLKLRDDIFIESEKMCKHLKQPRNAYINAAVAYFNRLCRRRELRKALAKESALVSGESMAILAEFEAFHEDIQQ